MNTAQRLLLLALLLGALVAVGGHLLRQPAELVAAVAPWPVGIYLLWLRERRSRKG